MDFKKDTLEPIIPQSPASQSETPWKRDLLSARQKSGKFFILLVGFGDCILFVQLGKKFFPQYTSYCRVRPSATGHPFSSCRTQKIRFLSGQLFPLIRRQWVYCFSLLHHMPGPYPYGRDGARLYPRDSHDTHCVYIGK